MRLYEYFIKLCWVQRDIMEYIKCYEKVLSNLYLKKQNPEML